MATDTLELPRALVSDAECQSLRRAVGLETRSRVLLIHTQGLTA